MKCNVYVNLTFLVEYIVQPEPNKRLVKKTVNCEMQLLKHIKVQPKQKKKQLGKKKVLKVKYYRFIQISHF